MNDLWQTPQPVFDWIANEIKNRFNQTFDIDLAANEHNKKCDRFIGEASQYKQWHEVSKCGFCNPPFSKPNLPEFTIHAWNEGRFGYNSVLLVPFDITGWFRENVANKAEIWVPDERIAYIDPETKKPVKQPPKGSMILLYGPMATPGKWEVVHVPQER